jgi:hypothetical protein
VIVPLEVKVEQLDEPDDAAELEGTVYAYAPRYRVELLSLDTEAELVRRYEFHSMVDCSHLAEREVVGVQAYSPLDAERGYLTKLRDQISEVLDA